MITLDRLVNVLGGYGAQLCCCPRSRDVALRSVALHDPAESRPSTGDVFLAVGLTSPVRAVRLAAQAHATCVLLRGTPPLDDDALAEATEQGVAVLVVDPAVSWSHLSGVAYGLVLESRETEAGRGPTDLFALADALADEVGGAVTVEDQDSRVLAYSSRQQDADRARSATILGRRVPDDVRAALAEQGVFAHLAASDEPLFVPPSGRHGLTGRVVIAVRAGRELLGSIWVDTEGPLTPSLSSALADGARTAALHLLRTRTSADLERQVESDRVIALLEGTADALAVRTQLGLPARSCRVIGVQAHVADTKHAAALLAFERATTGFGWARPGRSALFGNTLYTLLPCGDDPAPARAWIDTLIEGLPHEVTVHAGVGGPGDVASLPTSRHEADESLALHAMRTDQASAVVYDDSWHDILLARLRATAFAGRAPARGPIADLFRHDRDSGTEYVRTLRCWLQAQGDLPATSRALGVHPNTVRYRMRRMSELTRLELDQPDKRLAMIIALAVEPDTDTP